MKLELKKSYPIKVASLVTGSGMSPFLDFGLAVLVSLPINLLPEELGITAVDRLYPLKPKNPI
ncbi:hypothetical protein FHS59_003910 [Algoriphagus iocasae]|uniref:Uncharacterized protein n=1 Tax=Algoriphagus iocasae TaxID=1836499 RepID=A0A841MRW6_9BACT|nr:hypothetical protein [Algoriphagus iocasae]